jgi:hypothetical protein
MTRSPHSAQTSDAVSAESGPDYPEQIGLGFAEILALLALDGGESAPATAELLGIEEFARLPEVVSAGASSLVAHGYAHVGPSGELSVEGPMAGIATALGRAERRMDLTLESPEWTDRIILLEAPGIAVLLRPRAYSTWWALPQRIDLSPAEATLALVRGHLAERPGGRVLVERHDVGRGYALSVRRAGRNAGDGAWLLGIKPPGADAATEEPGDDATLLAALRAVRND